MKYLSLILSALLIFAFGCENQAEVDLGLIEEYILENNLDAQSTAEGIFYVIEKTGTGLKPNLGSTVTVHYEGYYLDGTIFDSSYQRGEMATFPLLNVIQGWQIGIPLIQEGGKIKLIIPSEYAYGRQGRGSVPGNAILVFDVELFDVD